MLLGNGLSPLEIARRTGIPRSTVRDWRDGRTPPRPREFECPGQHLRPLDEAAYAYLLGMYLGDGCISDHPRGMGRLRITLDAVYPGIAAECAKAEALAPASERMCVARLDEFVGPKS